MKLCIIFLIRRAVTRATSGALEKDIEKPRGARRVRVHEIGEFWISSNQRYLIHEPVLFPLFSGLTASQVNKGVKSYLLAVSPS